MNEREAKFRDALARLTLPEDGHVPRYRRPRRRTEAPSSGPVDVRRVNDRVVSEALKLAGGDPSRLRFLPDGSAVVENEPRA